MEFINKVIINEKSVITHKLAKLDASSMIFILAAISDFDCIDSDVTLKINIIRELESGLDALACQEV